MQKSKISGKHEKKFIRNISIISHVDHGKTTLSDHLIASGGMLPSHLAGSLRALDFLPSEQNRGITIESSIASFHISNEKDETILINLIDTPGHVDFLGKVTEALHLVDNALILVDAVEGIMSQTVTVLHQAIKENLNLVLFINKIDRLITELEFNRDQMAQRIERIIGELYSICKRQGYQGTIPSFANNRVIIGSALDGWAVNRRIVAQIGKIDGIISWYKSNTKHPKEANLTKVFTWIFSDLCTEPCKNQTKKYQFQLPKDQKQEWFSLLEQCSPQNEAIMVTGKHISIDKSRNIQTVVRILSGTIKPGMELYSTTLNKTIKIEKLFLFRGRRMLKTDEVTTGHIVGIIFSDVPPIGDVISVNTRSITNNDIKYLQEPVVSLSIEPLEFENYDDLFDELKYLSSLTPGVTLDLNQDTGEILLSAIGTLQLDLIIEEVEDKGYSIITSEPQVMEYMIPVPQNSKTLVLDNWIIEVMRRDVKTNTHQIYEKNENTIILPTETTDEFIDGLIETIERMTTRGKLGKIRGLQLVVQPKNSLEKYTYEDGIIIASKSMNFAIDNLEFYKHEPFYRLNIITSKQYVGKIVHLIQQMGGNIEEIISTNTSQIKVEVPISVMGVLSDELRKVTDGNIIWNIETTLYRKK